MVHRRRFLLWIATAGMGALQVRHARAHVVGHTSPAPDVGRTIATKWVDQSALGIGAQSTGEVREFTSQPYRAPHLFMAIGSSWPPGVTDLAVRVRGDTGDWSDWLPVNDHESHVGRDDLPDPDRRGIVVVPLSRFVQYRYRLQPGQPAVGVPLTLIDSTDGPSAPLQAAAPQPQPVISRAGWGADESLRFNSNGAERWPRAYRVVQKGVVHHTVTDSGGNNPAAVVRAIYYFHAIDRGWGDIGYNYLIDWMGNIYEGRYGGDNVVAGHALGYNAGSLGVACIGDYRAGGHTITIEMRRALARLLAWKCRYIDPHGNTYFIDRTYPNLGGHRDYNTTTCPGEALYELLPGLRGDVLWNLDGQRPQPAGQITGVRISPTTFLTPSASSPRTLSVEVTIKNVGTGLMVTQGPGPGYTYGEGDTFRTRGFAEIADAWRVGIEVNPPGSSLGVDHPYRWGLPDALEPGKSVTITGKIQLAHDQDRTAWAGLVREGVAWAGDQAGTTAIRFKPVQSRYYMPFIGR